MRALNKSVAIITGASRGIGFAIASYLASKDYQLLLISRNQDGLRKAVAKIKDKTPYLSYEPIIAAIDVSDYAAIKICVDEFLQSQGHIDLLCNNAGIAERGSSNLSFDNFQKMIKTNLIGAFNLIQTVTPYMKSQREGRIINIASYSGVVAKKNMGGYAASKFGMLGLNEAIYKELAEFGIHVTALCPNLVRTEMTARVGMKGCDMMQVSDVVKALEFILSLSPSVAVEKIVMQCRSSLIMENAAQLY